MVAPTRDEALAHFGIKGMHWGTRKAPSSAPTNRQLNKASRAADRAARDKEIDAARQRFNTQSRAKFLKAKAQFQEDKKTIGSRAARQKFNAVKQKNIDDAEIANMAKSGKETTKAVLATVGLVTLATVLHVAANAGRV